MAEVQVDTLLLTYGIDTAYAILLLVGGWLMTAWAARMVNRALDRSRRIDATLRPVIVNFVRYVILGMVAVAALAKFGIQTASILAVIGAAGLAIALALQNTLTNVASGLMLLLLRPFGVGDDVDCEGISGTVREIGLFATEFETADGLYVMVPNTQLFGKPMKNYSRLPYRRVEVKVGIAYSEDIEKALAAALAVLKSDPRVISDKPAQAVVDRLGMGSVELALRCWTHRDNYWSLFHDLQKSVKARFDADGILIPFQPQEFRVLAKK
jgi:small conductance mechanosensitive channel